MGHADSLITLIPFVGILLSPAVFLARFGGVYLLDFSPPCCAANSPASSPLPVNLKVRRGFIPDLLSQESGGGTCPTGTPTRLFPAPASVFGLVAPPRLAGLAISLGKGHIWGGAPVKGFFPPGRTQRESLISLPSFLLFAKYKPEQTSMALPKPATNT